MGGCVKSRHYLRKSRHSQRKSKHWTCYGLAKHLLLFTRSKFVFFARKNLLLLSKQNQEIFLKSCSENFSQWAYPHGNIEKNKGFPCKKGHITQLFAGKSGKHVKWTGPTAHTSNWEFSSAAYTKNRHTGTMSVHRYTTTYMEDAEKLGCLTRRTCDNQTTQHSITWMSQKGKDSSSRTREPHRCRISVRVITPFPMKFRLIIATLCRIIYIIM